MSYYAETSISGAPDLLWISGAPDLVSGDPSPGSLDLARISGAPDLAPDAWREPRDLVTHASPGSLYLAQISGAFPRYLCLGHMA